MNSPIAVFSSAVVRISVTCGLWTCSRRSANCCGHRVERAEVDHVDGADRADVRHPGPGDRADPVEAGGEDAADDVVGHLGRGHVENRHDHAGVDELLHRLAAGTGGVEDERVVSTGELLGEPGDEWCRDPEHREPDRRQVVVADRHGVGDHADDRVGRIAEHLTGDPVEPDDVGDRVHHRDVGRARRREPRSTTRPSTPSASGHRSGGPASPA